MASAEIVPFAKTGGMADVVGALSAELAEVDGIKINMVMPAYRRVIESVIEKDGINSVYDLNFDRPRVNGCLCRYSLAPSLNVYFIRADEFFDREGLYGDASGDYADNATRFAYFSRAVLEVARREESSILHLHDWQASPAAAMLKAQPEIYQELAGSRCVLTVHNLAYQGLFDYSEWAHLGLPSDVFQKSFEFYGRINYLKSGLVAADRLTTVSPSYAAEIQSEGYGFGLEGVLRQRSGDLVGILNGVDYCTWNPEADPLIPFQYTAGELAGKMECKKTLQAEYGLKSEPDVPLVCMVTRMVEGKGLELIMEAGDALFEDREFQFVLLGSGQKYYQDYFNRLALRFPDRVGVKTGFDEPLAHRTIAGSDILLMPSLREPCGLTQLYALRYGTVPVVRRTGGLADTIEPYNSNNEGNGFVFPDYSGKSMAEGLSMAIKFYHQKSRWTDLVRRAMNADHSWSRSMREYLKIYQELI